jgi:hypothetical protein
MANRATAAIIALRGVLVFRIGSAIIQRGALSDSGGSSLSGSAGGSGVSATSSGGGVSGTSTADSGFPCPAVSPSGGGFLPPESPNAPRKSEKAELCSLRSSCSIRLKYTADMGILWGCTKKVIFLRKKTPEKMPSQPGQPAGEQAQDE